MSNRFINMPKKFITKSYRQTQKLGESLAKEILEIPAQKHAVVLALSGNLGGGKTTFLQGFAKGLGVKDKVLSPTFVIMKRFKVPSSTFQSFYHFDCYRFKKAEDILELNFKEIISNPKNIVAIEWPERIKKVLPKNTVWIKFTCPESRRRVDKTKREINFKI